MTNASIRALQVLLSLSLSLLLSCGGGGGGGTPTPPPPPAPTITLGASPSSIAPGQSSTLSWSSTNATAVTLSGISGSFGPSGSTAVSPTTTTTYTATASGSGGTAQASATVTVTAPAPTVTDFNPKSGPVGTVVTVTGTGFSSLTAVKFNGTAATAFSAASATQLTATVPAGATSGPIAVTAGGQTATSSGSFTVTTVQGFSAVITTTPALPPVTQQPLAVTTRLTLTANPTGGTAPFRYQWKKAGQAIVGATGSTFVIPSLNLSDQAEYTVEVQDAATLTATSPGAKVFIWAVANLDFKPLGIAMKGSVQFTTAPELAQVRVLDTKTGDRFGPVQLPAGSEPTGITVGTDGNLWVTLKGSGEVARIQPTSLATQRWTVGEKPHGIAAATNGDIWFTLQGQSKVGRIPATGGTPTLFDASASSTPAGLTVASDGTVWFTERDLGQIGRIKPGASQVEEWICAHANARPEEILVTGGKVYYNDKANAAVVSFTIGEQAAGSAAMEEVEARDYRRVQAEARIAYLRPQLPYRNAGLDEARRAPAAVQPAPASRGALNRAFAYGVDSQGGPAGIALDGSGFIWLTQLEVGKVTRLAPDGSTYTFDLPSSLSRPSGITVGSSGEVWVSLAGTRQLAQVPVPQPITVSINAQEPKRALKGETLNFTAVVTGTTNAAITWEVLEPNGGSITQGGVYTAPSTAGKYHLIARSQEDPGRFGRLAVIVYPYTKWPEGQMVLWTGNVDGPGNFDGVGTEARFYTPSGIAVDSQGHVYTCDVYNHTIRKIDQDGRVTTLAGSPSQTGASDGKGRAARFSFPAGLATDAAGGRLVVADQMNCTVRNIAPDGATKTLAGLAGIWGNTDGSGSTASFFQPMGICMDPNGTVFVADHSNHTIRRIATDGTVSTVAGEPQVPGDSDGKGTSAHFFEPRGIAVDAAGNLFVADAVNATIRKIDVNGQVTTLAGKPRTTGHVNGPGLSARFFFPSGLALDGTNSLLVADGGDSLLRRVAPDGTVSDVVETIGQLNQPNGVAVAASGRVFISDFQTMTVRTYVPGQQATILAGKPAQGARIDGKLAEALFSRPGGICADKAGNLFLADAWNCAIRKVDTTGMVSTVAGGDAGWADGLGTNAKFQGPDGIATDGNGNLYVADTWNYTVRKIDAAGNVTTLAGGRGQRGSENGTGTAARFDRPTGIAVDPSGNLYIADTANCLIRKVSPTGVVTTLAGLAGTIGSRDGDRAVATFHYPEDVAVDPDGNIWVADTGNHCIRKISPAGSVATVSGVAGLPGLEDGPPASAKLNSPQRLTFDSHGTLMVSEPANNTLRILGTDGFLSTLVGDVGTGINRPGRLRDGSDLPLGAGYGSLAWNGKAVDTPDGSWYVLAVNGVMKVTFSP